VLDPITAYQIDTMLEGVVQRGTGAAAQVLDRPVAGKTGTTNDFRSAWFIGFTPQIVVATYVGFDDNRSLGKGETGAVAALPIFIEFMEEALKGYAPRDFTAPAGTKFANIGPNREAFRPGTEPQPPAPRAVNTAADENSETAITPAGGVLPAPGAPAPIGPIERPTPAIRPPKPPDNPAVPF